MSYLALARKWRPRSFQQLLGQDFVAQALTNSLDQQRLHHAYLFTGTRGVGKTSVARLLAKAMNCEQGISATPCLNCQTCIEIEQGRFIDLIEIDAASKTRVEDTRDILDNVQYASTAGRFKIYLIDEVHMLSLHSFNALLKTLEEPPAHVKFLLATTDPQKIPITVLSRCLQFHLKPLEQTVIIQQLQTIAEEENLSTEIDALQCLAKAAQGSMRDALSLMDQVIAVAASDKIITRAIVAKLLGYTQQDYALPILTALAHQSAQNLIQITRNIAAEGGHFAYVMEELMQVLHEIALYQNVPHYIPMHHETDRIQSLAHQIAPEDIQLFYQFALKGAQEMYLAPVLSMGFEMVLLRMLAFRPALPTQTPKLYYETLTPTAPSSIAAIEPSSSIAPAESFKTLEMTPAQRIEPIIKPALENTKKNDTYWAQVVSTLHLTGLAQTAISHTELIEKQGQELILRIQKGHESLFTPNIIKRIEEALSNYYQEKQSLVLKVEEHTTHSPAQKKQQANHQAQEEAIQSLTDDPFFKNLQNEFDAELVKNSVIKN